MTDIFQIINNKIPHNVKTSFFSGIILGWITHFYMLTHKLPNWDDISQVNSLGLTKQIGRWMLEPLQNLGQRASNPAIHGMLLIVFISLAASIIVATLEFKTITSSVLTAAIMVTFPSVTGVLFFMFTAHLYALGVLLFCLSVFLIRKYKYGFVPAGICIILGLALYQPFIGIALSLMLASLMLDSIKGGNFKNLLKSGLIYAGTVLISTYLYIVIAHWIYPNMGQESYGGVSEMGKISIPELPKNFGRVYKRVLEYFITRPFSFTTPGMRVLNVTTCVLVIILFVLCVIKYDLWKRKLELVFAGLMAFLFPFAIGFVYFMAPSAPFSLLMLYAYLMIYILLLSLCETYLTAQKTGNVHSTNKAALYAVSALTTILVSLVAYNNYLLDSQAYFRSSIAFERATNYYNRIISSVESIEGFQYGDRVAILGEFYYKDNPSPIEIRLFYDDEGLRELSGVALENGLITSGVRSGFVKTYIGFDMGKVSEEEKESIMGKEEYMTMPTYPHDGSIAQIDGIWVVKLCD